MFAPHWLARFDYRCADLGTIRHSFFVNEVIQSPVAATRVRTHRVVRLRLQLRILSLSRDCGVTRCAAATRQADIAVARCCIARNGNAGATPPQKEHGCLGPL
jgi:hypothetical protein